MDHAPETAVLLSGSDGGSESLPHPVQGGATLIVQSADTNQDFRDWLQQSGVDSLLPGDVLQDNMAFSADNIAAASHLPRSVAEAVRRTFLHDRAEGSVTRLDRDPRVIGIAPLGEGATSHVYAGTIHDRSQLKHDSAGFVRSLLGEDREDPAPLVSRLEQNVDRVASGTRLAVTKVLALSDPMLRSRVQREIRTAIRLGDKLPHVPGVIGGIVNAQEILFHMEHIPGLDIKHLLEAQGGLRPLPFRFATDLAAMSARALALTARAGIVHRDIKPANLYVGNRGHFRVLDLGFVRSLDQRSLNISIEGTALGTPDYISPEAANGTLRPTPAVDTFSHGMMLTQVFTGRLPYRGSGATPLNILYAHKSLTADDEPPELEFPESLGAGEDPVRFRRFLGILQPMLRAMIHPDPLKRPAPDDVADFFRQYSSFGEYSLEEFLRLSAYDDIQLSLDPPPPVSEGDTPVFHGYATDREMLNALESGSRKRTKRHDFLSSPEFGRAQEDAIPVLKKPRGGRSFAAGIGGAVALTAAGVAFVLSRNHTTPESPVPPVRSVAPDPDPKQVKAQDPPPVQVEEKPEPSMHAMDLQISSNGPEELRLFKRDSLIIPKEQLMALRSGRENGSAVCGAGFVCSAQDIATLFKCGSPHQLPEKIRSTIVMQENGLGGVMGVHIITPGGARCTWIISLGIFIENDTGMVFYANHPEAMDLRKEECLRSGGTPDMFKDDVFVAFMREAPEIVETGTIPPTWQKKMAEPGTFPETINKNLRFWRGVLEKQKVAAKN